MSKGLLHRVFDNVYLAQGSCIPQERDVTFHCFATQELEYNPFCDDFGPMNVLSIVKFVQILDYERASSSRPNIAYCVESGKRALTNAAFLLGSFLILKRNEPPSTVWSRFDKLCPGLFEGYRDATFARSSFQLTLLDCWSGLARGVSMGWIGMAQPGGKIWGQIWCDEYEHYDNPLNGDLHIVVPDRFVAFKGPKDLPSGSEYGDSRGFRDFSPKYYVEIFKELGVKAVVRLNESEYDADIFDVGVVHHDLEFEDCTSPPDHIVERFFEIVESTKGAVAVHCKAGLGRTGTLIALDMMWRHKFTAREAMGWLRIMRPGCVIGEQQHYLVATEEGSVVDASHAALDDTDQAQQARVASALADGFHDRRDETLAAVLAQQVADAISRRAAGRAKALCANLLPAGRTESR